MQLKFYEKKHTQKTTLLAALVSDLVDRLPCVPVYDDNMGNQNTQGL